MLSPLDTGPLMGDRFGGRGTRAGCGRTPSDRPLSQFGPQAHGLVAQMQTLIDEAKRRPAAHHYGAETPSTISVTVDVEPAAVRLKIRNGPPDAARNGAGAHGPAVGAFRGVGTGRPRMPEGHWRRYWLAHLERSDRRRARSRSRGTSGRPRRAGSADRSFLMIVSDSRGSRLDRASHWSFPQFFTNERLASQFV